MCGIFGVTNKKNSAFLTYIALYSLQHRGQESCGIVSFTNSGYKYYNGMGLVQEVFNKEVIEELNGNISIGHVRYSTTGSSTLTNAQPLFFNTKFGEFAVAHNGNIVNSKEIKEKLSSAGAIFQTTTDSEIIAHLISRSNKNNFLDALIDSLKLIKGAYSFIFLYHDMLIGVRDRWGFRPLVIGKGANSYAISSETCAFDVCGYKYIKEVLPGEIVIIKKDKLKNIKYAEVDKYYRCIFEQVYFARPDSVVLNSTIFVSRYRVGIYLAKEFNNRDVDIVSGVPDSGTPYALGFSKQSKIPYCPVFMKNHYAPRSFLAPQQTMREFIADLKLSPIKDTIKDKKIILIDDSIVRGTTSKKIVSKLRDAGAKKIIFLIASPPIKGPCYYGIDTPTEDELIANNMDIEGIRDFIGVDELYYIKLESLINAHGEGDKNYCTACFDKKYPVL